MVSKIAVMALVAIVATPILLGYGLNIETESYTDWVEDGDSQDLTNYLYSVVDASKRNYTDVDIYQLNSDIFYQWGSKIYPEYEHISNTRTPIKLVQDTVTSQTISYGAWLNWGSFVAYGEYDAGNYWRATITYTNSTTEVVDHIKALSIVYASGSGTAEYSITEPGPAMDPGYTRTGVATIEFRNIGWARGLFTYENSGTTTYPDISKGYRLNTDSSVLTAPIPDPSDFFNFGFGITSIYPNGICKDLLLTINLDSITNPSYYIGIRLPADNDITISLQKRTTGSGVEWFYKTIGDNEEHQLYYNPDLSSNTYQLYLNGLTGGEFRYTGAWTDTVSPAPALITYPFSYVSGAAFDYIHHFEIIGRTPIMRMDYAQAAAFEYKIIQDTTYDPSVFKQNPLTKLTNMAEWGTSLVFGGNTYNVTNGNITIDSKSVSVRNLQLSSVFNGSGYDNMINGTVVSTTLTPSTITFNGDWSMSVSTIAQKSIQKETTKWVPGKFAWNGIDTDFKIVGLMASLGAFVALAIYGRRSGSNVLPLLLVCGGAALMFLVMI